MDFASASAAELENTTAADLDRLPFGVIGMNRDTTVHVYNATEARLAGLDATKVIGAPFFDAIAQCMNNFMVAQRFEDEAELDAIIPYVLTLRMRPTKVRLRMLATASAAHRYILIER
jgi:photoactive yellow protein